MERGRRIIVLDVFRFRFQGKKSWRLCGAFIGLVGLIKHLVTEGGGRNGKIPVRVTNLEGPYPVPMILSEVVVE